MTTQTAARSAANGLITRQRPGWTLEQPFYTDEALFAQDMAQVFRRHWLFAGHTTQIPQTGDYFLFTLGDDSIVVIRDDDGEIHAHFNVCRHRGSHLCLEPTGNVKKFVCPYHQWVYEKDGRLASARQMPDDFDRAEFGLYPVAVQVVESLIFLCFADEPSDFTSAACDYRAHLAPYQMEQSKIAFAKQYDLTCNWKLIAENFRECYHCDKGHPEYCRVVLGTRASEAWEQVREVNAERKEHWQKMGLETKTTRFTPETWTHSVRYPFRPGFVSESLDGQPVAPRMGTISEADAGVFAIVNLPNFWLEASADYVWTMRVTPVSAKRTLVDVWWSVRADAIEGRDYEVEPLTAFWRATAEQDWTFCEANQAGINSTRYQSGPYALSEADVVVFIQWYLNQLSA